MELLSIYSIPFWMTEYPDFEKDKDNFLEVVKNYREKTQSIEDVKYRYQSPNTLQKVSDLSVLFNYICHSSFKAIADLEFIECDIAMTSACLNINDSRQSMISEHLGEDTFTGVFYLQAPKGSGEMIIQNPAINKMWNGCKLTSQKNKFTAESIRINPEEGNIIIFPSYIPHSVETNNHDEETISISFNLIALPKGHIKYDQI